MAAKLARFLEGPEEEGVLQIPVTVSVPGQPLPVAVTLRAQVTTSDLTITPQTLDLGRVPLGERAGAALFVTNPGKLPQSFSFGCGGKGAPRGVEVSPGHGYGTVLPGETVRLLVSFRPSIPGPQSFALRCSTLAGRVFPVQGRCHGVEPPLALSHNVVRFPATAVDDTSCVSLVLSSRSSDVVHAFEFGVPVDSWLQVTPRVGSLAPGQSVRLQLEYSPPAALLAQQQQQQQQQALQGQAGSAAPVLAAAAACLLEERSAGDTALSGAQDQQRPRDGDGRWRQSREWVVPCFVRPLRSGGSDPPLDATIHATGSSSSGSAVHSSGGGGGGEGLGDGSSVLHLGVSVCAVAPELLLDQPPLPRPDGKNYYTLDFGQLAGMRVVHEVP
ncbi:hypothetical protein MNEG_16381 [Monoraphidium neglectum]|uniref:CFAP74 fourth Ig-like domain-containing protein n=1 Tax=Monoraphidium neglectum TaxID=145388 RepID=A0A0D2K602_9CHLO|nr:hypothetical protein MNEG_16381 [Monoraphidium neglectum]KIY91583.1 hypothetical protein MNEG_16381 [Monoraphidium neglectum]|eukprot:XP_013890603.1 hypothetical protein MNEG_16381 [Monoraphidium neglectum]